MNTEPGKYDDLWRALALIVAIPAVVILLNALGTWLLLRMRR